MKRSFGFGILMVLLIAMVATAGVSPLAPKVEQRLIGNEEVTIPANAPGFVPRAGELDEIMGDTLIVGSSYWDAQHNGGVGRQIAWNNNVGEVFFQWTKLYTEGGERHVPACRIIDNGDGTFTIQPDPIADVDANAQRSGYNAISFDVDNDAAYPTMHTDQNGSGNYNSYAYVENTFIPWFFSGFANPDVGGNPYIWPHSVFGGGYTHMVSHEQREGATDLMGFSYMRWEDNGSGSMIPATQDGEQVLLTTDGMNISADPAVSLDGNTVAVGLTVSRLATLGEDFGDPGQDDQWNNDVYVYMSNDGGLTWDLDNPVDVSQMVGPNPDLLPDTTAANGDTMRPYTDCSLVFDDEDRLHTAFTTQEFDFYRGSGFVMGHIWHHMKDDNGDDWWTRINFQPFNGVTVEGWARTTDRPNLYFDIDTGILWAVMEVIDGIAADGDTTDFGAGFFGNTDIYVSASPPGDYNGLLWTEPVNITNTTFTGEPPAPAGECRSETDPSIALRSEGDYLHIQYLLDLDAGTGIGSAPENTMTNNPMVYHRVSKQELIDTFEENAQWHRNYPLHVDSTGFWQDPAEWEWDEYEGNTLGGFFTTAAQRVPQSVNENGSLSPNDFDLKQNYPNPFNPSTNIEFSLNTNAQVKLAVYDVLGREVASLVNRGMKAGNHNVVFFGDDLPSGVYFYKLQAGDLTKTRKMVLMK